MTPRRPAAPEPAGEPTLEEALRRLEEITVQLDGSELELAEALALYEEGIGLLRVSERLLGEAHEHIRQLRPAGEGFRLDPLDSPP